MHDLLKAAREERRRHLAAAAARWTGAKGGRPMPTRSKTRKVDAADIAGAEKVMSVRYRGPSGSNWRGPSPGSRRATWPAAPSTWATRSTRRPSSNPVCPGRRCRGRSVSGGRARPPRALPARDADIAFATLADLSTWVRRRQIASVRLTELYLARLEEHDARLRAVVTPTGERALRQARRADRELRRGAARGPLHGIPWGAKDLLDTKGIATTWGAGPYAGRAPSSDAAVVRLLDEAGAVLVAKLSLGALAYGDVWHRARTRNPWNPDEGASGSSAGSAAAVAAGCVGFAIGSETLGSIVSPAGRPAASWACAPPSAACRAPARWRCAGRSTSWGP